jgi:hypothetical protein
MEFKVGDWAQSAKHKECVFKVVYISKQFNEISGTYGIKHRGCSLDDCILWEPIEKEWCWFWDDKLKNRQLLQFKNKWRNRYYTTTDGVTLTEHGKLVYTDYFTHCEPFIGELPRLSEEL